MDQQPICYYQYYYTAWQIKHGCHFGHPFWRRVLRMPACPHYPYSRAVCMVCEYRCLKWRRWTRVVKTAREHEQCVPTLKHTIFARRMGQTDRGARLATAVRRRRRHTEVVFHTSTDVLKITRWRTGSRWRVARISVMWSWRPALEIRRAVAFCTDCRRTFGGFGPSRPPVNTSSVYRP